MLRWSGLARISAHQTGKPARRRVEGALDHRPCHKSGRSSRRAGPGRLGASLEDFIGNPAYGIDELRQDLNRFVFLLGSDGEPLFGP